MLNRTKTALALCVVFAVGIAVWVTVHRGGEDPERLREFARSALELREGVLYVKGESKPFAGTVVERYPDGSNLTVLEIRDGKPHGPSRGWYENGQLEVEEIFAGGVSHGLRTRFYENGSKKSEANIVDGQIEGVFKRWHDNGELSATAEMVGGRPDGVSEAWHPDGSRKSRAVLKGGEIVEREFFEG